MLGTVNVRMLKAGRAFTHHESDLRSDPWVDRRSRWQMVGEADGGRRNE